MNSNTELGKDIIIYMLIDPITNEPRYIGKTKNLKMRIKGHLWPCSFKFKTHKTYWLKSLLNQNLEPIVEIIDKVSFKDSIFWEQHYIDLYKSWGFNLTNTICAKPGICALDVQRKKAISLKQSLNRKGKCMGDENPSKRIEVKKKISQAHKGKIVSKETKELMSQNNKGTKRNFSKEHRKNLSEKCKKRNLLNKGKKLSEDHIKKIKKNARRGESHFMYGKTHSINAKKKISESRKGKAQWSKIVKQYDSKSGECLKTFFSAAEASRFYNKGSDYIADACRNQRDRFGGIWKYEIELNEQ